MLGQKEKSCAAPSRGVQRAAGQEQPGAKEARKQQLPGLAPANGPVDADGQHNEGEQEEAEDASQENCEEKKKRLG